MRGRVPSRQPTGLYVHSSPPTGVPVVFHDSVVRQWLRGGEISRLKELVLEGDGATLVGEYSPDVTARAFIRALPRILSRIDEAHKAAAAGDVDRVERAVKRERAVRIELSKDHSGLSLLHKAVIHGHHNLQEWLIQNYPETVHLTDRERRTALHYAGSSPDSEVVWKRLTEAGADTAVIDSGGNTPGYYMHHPRRARPPQPRGVNARQDKGGLVVKPANIRIWIHDRDLGRLQRVVWEGHGQKLVSETSSQPKVRRFLNAVPYIMVNVRSSMIPHLNLQRSVNLERRNARASRAVMAFSKGRQCLSEFLREWYFVEDCEGSIRDVHKAAIENDVETILKKSEDPVPKDILLSKDVNGLNPLHKAAGLGQKEAMQEILSRAPEAANSQDNLGRTPLHYAAGLRDPELYTLLVEGGATDHLQDKRGNTPSYYRSKPGELEGGKLLSLVPEAPRTAHIFPPSWDWRLLQAPATGVKREDSAEAPLLDSNSEEITQEDSVSKDEGPEESRPEMSEDEGVGSENAQSIDENASPQGSENIDMEAENESEDRLGQTVTISRSDIFGDDSAIADAEADLSTDINSENMDRETNSKLLQEPEINKDEISQMEEAPELTEEEHEAATEDQRHEENLARETKALDTQNENTTNSANDDHDEKAEEISSINDSELSNLNDIKEQENSPDKVTDPDEKEDSSEGTTTLNEENSDIIHSENYEKESTKEDDPPLNISNPDETDEIKITESNENTEPPVDVKPDEEMEPQESENTQEPDNMQESDNKKDEHTEENIEPDQGNDETTVHDGCTYEKKTEGNDPEAQPAPLVRSETIVLQSTINTNNKENSPDEKEQSKQQVIDEETGEESNVKKESDDQSSEDSPKSDNKTNENQNSDILDVNEPENNPGERSGKKSGVVQSGRRSLKSRVENAIRLGRGHTEEEDFIKGDDHDNSGEIPDNTKNTQGSTQSQTGLEDEPNAEEYPDSLESTPRRKSAQSNKSARGTTDEGQINDLVNENGGKTPTERVSGTSTRTLPADGKGDRKSEAEKIVAAADMEAMAEMVLSGEGEVLLHLKSDNPDVQLFINNVPQYMAKIDKVHKASREGDLRGVQTSLDRRKFAVARDNATSLKPTPLHVAVLFGRTSVLRYLAGRFPETMHAQDSAGRTPLHYSATLPDNGHFYSLLITLGADKAILDNSGKTAEYYLRNPNDLTREMLLSEYQDRAVPIDTSGLNFNRYSDKGAEILREGYPIFKQEEGQYLAATLGEPLIKGLTEIAQLRPQNPIIHLANFLLAFEKNEDLDRPKTVLRSIEGTPAGHDIPKPDENEPEAKETDNLDDNLDDTAEEADDEKETEGDEGDELDGIESLENEEGRTSPDEGEGFKTVNRDEHGQSMLHFAAARSHGRNAMYQLLQEMDANPGLRDSLYRTARDIADQMEISENIKGIDRYVIAIAARGEEKKLKELLLEGYDHILDADDGGNIMDIVEERGHESILEFLKGITAFEENREKLHRAIRFGSLVQAQEIFNKCGTKHRLAVAKNVQGRTSLHVAVLSQHEPSVEHIATKYPATLHIGDNLMRTPLHYAMALEKVEHLSRILIAAGAQRVLKDLKGRQPSYYFMNKTDIQKLQEEEEALRV